ncbi:D-isomer specific 2-hydroxyacid dehydrogenase [Chlorella sorokiniana]|uniref:D-isomer specific 2-hydroxyacid dehydrogenase n=1 Tax=Chlorella sorokiniana TaxID=3076 RepID=A0A2P6U1Q9_CHLSO|nr:D-isomer specific 2-hydroxyacid dehydrogenase [Chlorella sorokiniana]|eukprot:PRW60252.1 D-isomer specific 2-hydroxyacid dehydrogenase [Chlorella sorokiniana]
MSAAADEEEIVASGEALRTVAGWLGVADVGDVMEKEGLNPEFEQGRTQGLGLGAKFLPHHKAVALTTGVEHRLSSKIKRSQERQAAAGAAVQQGKKRKRKGGGGRGAAGS